MEINFQRNCGALFRLLLRAMLGKSGCWQYMISLNKEEPRLDQSLRWAAAAMAVAAAAHTQGCLIISAPWVHRFIARGCIHFRGGSLLPPLLSSSFTPIQSPLFSQASHLSLIFPPLYLYKLTAFQRGQPVRERHGEPARAPQRLLKVNTVVSDAAEISSPRRAASFLGRVSSDEAAPSVFPSLSSRCVLKMLFLAFLGGAAAVATWKLLPSRSPCLGGAGSCDSRSIPSLHCSALHTSDFIVAAPLKFDPHLSAQFFEVFIIFQTEFRTKRIKLQF